MCKYLAAVIHVWWSVCVWKCVCVASVCYYTGYGVCTPGEGAPSSSPPPIRVSWGSLVSLGWQGVTQGSQAAILGSETSWGARHRVSGARWGCNQEGRWGARCLVCCRCLGCPSRPEHPACPECDGDECCSSRLLMLHHTLAASPKIMNGWMGNGMITRSESNEGR